MKRNLILIFMCAVGCIAHAQDMIVTFMNDSATITIGGTTYDSKHEIKLCKEISSVKIEESPNLPAKQEHYIKINGVNVSISDSNAKLLGSYTYTLATPFTLHFGEIITVYRGATLCATFHVESKAISKNEVVKKSNSIRPPPNHSNKVRK